MEEKSRTRQLEETYKKEAEVIWKRIHQHHRKIAKTRSIHNKTTHTCRYKCIEEIREACQQEIFNCICSLKTWRFPMHQHIGKNTFENSLICSNINMFLPFKLSFADTSTRVWKLSSCKPWLLVTKWWKRIWKIDSVEFFSVEEVHYKGMTQIFLSFVQNYTIRSANRI